MRFILLAWAAFICFMSEVPVAGKSSLRGELAAGLAAHDRALFVKPGWIRDPYIVLGPDNLYYLTGTTPLPDDPRRETDPYETGLGAESIVGWKMQVWRSKDLIDWEPLGTPYTLQDGIWSRAKPQAFANIPKNKWRLWAPELHWLGERWALVHTSPAPVDGANLSLTSGHALAGPWKNPMGAAIGRRHDPSLFEDDDGTWWMIWGATSIAPLKPDFSGFTSPPVEIRPSGESAKMGHEGCLIQKIGGKYVLFGTGWSTGQMRRGSYNLYYAVADKITGPYSERKFAGRFLGHGTPFRDKQGRWWCTAFYNANVPPLARDGIEARDLGSNAHTINAQGVTLVPIDVQVDGDGVHIRAKDSAYARPGPDEKQKFVDHATTARPNFVIFLTDDHGQLDSSPYGATGIRTPNMQRLATVGMKFTRAYVASPSCAPSRAALLTGLMPARNGAEANHDKPRPEIRKWPAYFQELGYEVVAFGKVSHYRHTADYGFDRFAHDVFHDHAGIPAAVEFLKNRNRAHAKPLCLFVGSNWPHVPWPEKDLGYDPDKLPLPAGSIDTPETRAWRARYAAAVTKGDDDLGLIMDAAREHLPRDTLFLFSSDHGAQWPFGKWNLYESGVCVPLIVAWPGVVKANSRSDAMVNWTDFLPTLLESAGGRSPADIDGRSFLPVLRGETGSHREHIFTTHANDDRMNVYPSRAVRNARWKYIRNLHPEYAFTTHIDLVSGYLGQRAFFSTWETAAKTDPGAAAILKRYHARPAEELYDLTADPHEQRNLAADARQAAPLAALRAELEGWMKAQGDRQRIFAEPRLLSDSTSYGSRAEIIGSPKQAPKKNAAR